MKISRIGLATVLLMAAVSVIAITTNLYALDMIDTMKAADASKYKNGDDPAKKAVIADQKKIDSERNAILADIRKLQEAKKTRDAALIEKVKKEVEKDVKARKAVIRSLKDDIQAKEGSITVIKGNRRDEGNKR